MVKRYLSLISLDQAVRLTCTSFEKPDRSVRIPVIDSSGRVSSTPVYAKYSVPEVNLAAMDGFAVRSRDTVGASDQSPVIIEDFTPVNTGNIVPPEFDAVIMIEDTWKKGNNLQIRKSVSLWQHIRPAGEDVREGQLVLPEGHRIRPFDIGALATYGIVHIDAREVNVGLIPTGSELVNLGIRPGPGQVVESNTIMAQVFLNEMGANCTRYPIARDKPEIIEESLCKAVDENDLVLISAGSSAGSRDYTAEVIESVGELLFHGVAMKPGKPAMLGKINGKPVIGLPGYPLAAQTVLREFAGPLLQSWGLPAPLYHTFRVQLSGSLVSDLGFDEFIPVSVGHIGSTYYAIPHSRGSGIQMATVKANGFVHIPAFKEGCDSNTEMEAVLTTDPGNIERTLLLSGAYDPALDELAHLVRNLGIFMQVRSAGNIGAVLSLRHNSCHAAPLSLPDFSFLPNCREIMQLLPLPDLRFIHIAATSLGIVSMEGYNFDDIINKRFINRQKGTSARMILDSFLQTRGVDPAQIDGYGHEVETHKAVAEAIRNGFADAGICTSGVAEENGLLFIPLVGEQFELAIRTDLLKEPNISALVSTIQSDPFKVALAEKGGYNLSQTGLIRCLSEDFSVKEYFSIESASAPLR
ncbi:MAG: molybdopterin biosynthesis protein [Methanomicrobiales archaeon]